MLRALLQSLKIVAILAAAGLTLGGGIRFFDYYRDKAAVAERVGQPVVVTIKKTAATTDVAKQLSDAGLINSELYFKTVLRLTSRDIKPATYTLRHGMSTRTIVDLITTEKSKAKTNVKDLKLTIPEGWRTTQIAEELDKIGYAPGGAAFLEAVKTFKGDGFDFLKDRPDSTSLEGYLFPDTYTFASDAAPADIIQQMLQNFDGKFDKDMRARAAKMNLSVGQVLIFASLIEREAKVGSERPIIADVYLNRYVQGMRLEADPTVQYVLGKPGKWWEAPTAADLENTDSPYNTYKVDGLPPGPICNPGRPSILAVLQPAGTANLFFVAKQDGSGSHAFAENIDQQTANIDKYLKGGGGAPTDTTSVPPADAGAVDAVPTDVPVDTSGETVPIQSTDNGGG